MIVINNEGLVLGCSTLIERVDAQGEIGLIKVGNSNYYYIGTDDRDTYTIIDNIMVPDISRTWSYINGIFTDITINTTPPNGFN